MKIDFQSLMKKTKKKGQTGRQKVTDVSTDIFQTIKFEHMSENQREEKRQVEKKSNKYVKDANHETIKFEHISDNQKEERRQEGKEQEAGEVSVGGRKKKERGKNMQGDRGLGGGALKEVTQKKNITMSPKQQTCFHLHVFPSLRSTSLALLLS